MKLQLGDCVEALPTLKDASVDLLVTDPPYGISFMGKSWDQAVPSVEVWKQCLRVLKPGSFAFVMSLPRLDVLSQMAIRLQEAGFHVDFTPIFWAYASGFPKATNISKAADKRLGTFVEGELLPSTRDTPASASDSFTAFREKHAANPQSEQAKILDGSYAGFQPKPAVEVIIVAMKPLSEKTYVGQALKHGKGVTWLDEGRIPFQSEFDAETAHENALGPVDRFKTTKKIYEGGKDTGGFADTFSSKGRFPANLLVSDDVLNDGTNWTAGGGFHSDIGPKTRGIYGEYQGLKRDPFSYGDEGSFSRYFSLDAWWERKVSELPREVRKTFPFLIEPKASKGERNEGLESLSDSFEPRIGNGLGGNAPPQNGKRKEPQKNCHPTVKPISIMSYLITLGSRPNDVVLDPFMGSGTTGIAAKILGRDFIGIEINPEYFEIARMRISGEWQVALDATLAPEGSEAEERTA
jgi:DNA modification methylase